MSLNLTQSKLTRSEWNNIEVPVSDGEKEILRLIIDGYGNVNIKHNKNSSMFSFTKIERTDGNEHYLYTKYFAPIIAKTLEKYKPELKHFHQESATAPNVVGGGHMKKIKSIDALRLSNLETNIDKNRASIFEFLLLDFCNMMCRHLNKDATIYSYYLYTLIQLKKTTIEYINRHVMHFVDACIEYGNDKTEIRDIIENAYEFIERNPYLITNADIELYSHQKELFTIFAKNAAVNRPNLILYISPTGTGKTLSPLGLVQGNRVIFVCGARHIGLALAKSAISMEVKIAIAFGCETASDIRLHYFAAVDFTRDRKSGAIRKVDNSNGSKVELIICDLKSYLTAMHYMIAFNPVDKIITYWDEPTISMDRPEDPLHQLIHDNWVQNLIPNMVLSCATLPKEDEIVDTICDFRGRFPGANICTVSSYDCKKSISILTKNGDYGVPHLLYSNFAQLQECVSFCRENQTLLRYFDLSEVVRFITYVTNLPECNLPERSYIENHFDDIAGITMNSLKIYYLELLRSVPECSWTTIQLYMNESKNAKYQREHKVVNGNGETIEVSPIASVKITTEDAYTLTDGPTIFLTQDVMKIGNFYLQQSNIPQTVFQEIMATITQNNRVSEKINRLEKDIEDYDTQRNGVGSTDENKGKGASKKGDKKVNMDKMPADIRKTYKELDELRGMLQYVSLGAKYIPNTNQHLKIWTTEQNAALCSSVFMPMIDEETVKDIMSLTLDNSLKILLLLGIGIFADSPNARYMEIMKDLANSQRLFLIIADTDYIYGTNYQFCHGFLSRDLTNMTQQKIIQAMGRIGRGQIQQTYTVRFRDDDMIMGLFRKPAENMEAFNMSRLFCTE